VCKIIASLRDRILSERREAMKNSAFNEDFKRRREMNGNEMNSQRAFVSPYVRPFGDAHFLVAFKI